MRGPSKLFLAVATLIVVVALTAGFLIIPSPALQHMRDVDAKRSDALDTLATAINVYTNAHGTLPGSLATLVAEVHWAAEASREAEIGAALEYAAGPGLGYRLCTTYGAASPPDATGFYVHPAGYFCEARTARAARSSSP